jgi:hypothetical protein
MSQRRSAVMRKRIRGDGPKDGRQAQRVEKSQKEGLFARLNRALTEVGIEHFDDDRDWDARVKLPEWQLARLKKRYESRKNAGRLSGAKASGNSDASG